MNSLQNSTAVQAPSWLTVRSDEQELGRWYAEAPLGRILGDAEIQGIRDGRAYASEEEDLDRLKKSMIPDSSSAPPNVLNPLHTYLDPGGECLRVIGGNRRLEALRNLTHPDQDGNSTPTPPSKSSSTGRTTARRFYALP